MAQKTIHSPAANGVVDLGSGKLTLTDKDGVVDLLITLINPARLRYQLTKDGNKGWTRVVGKKELVAVIREYGFTANEASRAISAMSGMRIKNSFRG